MTDPDDTDMLAAEYVLGTLDADERAAAAARLTGDAVLARAVAAWEDRLAPLVATVAEVTPPPAVFDGIVARLFGPGATTRARPAGSGDLRRSLRRWQAATAGLGLLAASLLAVVVLRDLRPGVPNEARFTAVLQRDAGAPAIVLDIDLTTRRLTVRPVLASAPAGHSYELWIIDPKLGNPRSLGVVPARADTRESLAAYDPAVIAGATYAVTLEAAGGSPSGQPTAAPILAGKLDATGS